MTRSRSEVASSGGPLSPKSNRPAPGLVEKVNVWGIALCGWVPAWSAPRDSAVSISCGRRRW